MPILDGPMSIDQMKDWSEKASSYSQTECAVKLNKLALSDPHEPRRVWIRRVD